MSLREWLRTIRVLVLGETRILPVAVLAGTAASGAVRLAVGETVFSGLGGPLMLVVVAAALGFSVRR